MIEHELVLGNVDSPFLGEIATWCQPSISRSCFI
jgi:hypothetical protein